MSSLKLIMFTNYCTTFNKNYFFLKCTKLILQYVHIISYSCKCSYFSMQDIRRWCQQTRTKIHGRPTRQKNIQRDPQPPTYQHQREKCVYYTIFIYIHIKMDKYQSLYFYIFMSSNCEKHFTDRMISRCHQINRGEKQLLHITHIFYQCSMICFYQIIINVNKYNIVGYIIHYEINLVLKMNIVFYFNPGPLLHQLLFSWIGVK